jgi:hypothetical protein
VIYKCPVRTIKLTYSKRRTLLLCRLCRGRVAPEFRVILPTR